MADTPLTNLDTVSSTDRTAAGSQPDFSTPTGTIATGSSGTVTGVSASSPLTSSGGTSPNIAIASQTANKVLAGPTTGTAAPTFRALVAADVPTLPYLTSIAGSEFTLTPGGTGPAVNIATNNINPNFARIGAGATINGGMKATIQGAQGNPSNSGTTQTYGNYRVQTGNTVMDVGTRSSGKTWLQSYDATDLSLHYGIELNPLGGDTELGGTTGESFGQTKGARTGDVLRTWKARIGDVFNVKDFGAVGNGSTPDTTAIQAAVTAARTAGYGCVFFPAGVYIVNAAITNGGNALLSFVGQGQGVSQIKFTSTTAAAAFDLTFTANDYYATFYGLTFVAGAAVKRLVRYTGPGVSSSIFPGGQFIDCHFLSTDASNYYQTGLELVGAWAARVVNSHFCGKPNSDPSGTDGTGTGILVNATDSLSVNGLITGTRFSFLNKAFYIGGVDGSGYANNSTGAANCEGWTLRDCISLAMQWGVVALKSGTQTPWLTVSNCEFEPRRTGASIYAKNYAYVYVNDCTVLPESAQTIFQLDQVSFSTFNGNIISGTPVRVFECTNNCGVLKIFGNEYNGAGTEIYKFGSSTSNIRVRDDSVVTMPATWYTDSGTDNSIIGDKAGNSALAIRTTTQSIASGGSGTAVQWPTIVTNFASMWASGANTRLTVPSGAHKVRVSANIRWENSGGSAIRYFFIKKNGSTIYAGDCKPNIATGNSVITTSVLEVVAGDYFEAWAFQNEAGALNIEPSSAGECSFGMEIVA